MFIKDISCVACSKYLGIDLLKQKEHYPDPSHQARVCKNERQQVPRKRVKVRKSYVAYKEGRWIRRIKQRVASDISQSNNVLNCPRIQFLFTYLCAILLSTAEDAAKFYEQHLKICGILCMLTLNS